MIIGLIGYIGSGKNTVSDIIVEEYGFKHDSFAATLKDVCSAMFGWDRTLLDGNTEQSRIWRTQVDKWWEEKLGIRDFTPRLALQLVGTDVIRNNFNTNMWTLSLERRLHNADNIVISDTRFPNEIDLIRKYGGYIVRVDNNKPPIWENVAIDAYHGDNVAKNIMEQKYSHVHFSEWAWAGVQPDIVIYNISTLCDLKKEIKTKIENITKT